MQGVIHSDDECTRYYGSINTTCIPSTTSTTKYYRLLQNTTGYYKVPQVTTKYYRILQSTAGYYKKYYKRFKRFWSHLHTRTRLIQTSSKFSCFIDTTLKSVLRLFSVSRPTRSDLRWPHTGRVQAGLAGLAVRSVRWVLSPRGKSVD